MHLHLVYLLHQQVYQLKTIKQLLATKLRYYRKVIISPLKNSLIFSTNVASSNILNVPIESL